MVLGIIINPLSNRYQNVYDLPFASSRHRSSVCKFQQMLCLVACHLETLYTRQQRIEGYGKSGGSRSDLNNFSNLYLPPTTTTLSVLSAPFLFLISILLQLTLDIIIIRDDYF